MDFLRHLFNQKFLSKEQVDFLSKELKNSSKSLEEMILEKRMIEESVLFELKSQFLKIPLRRINTENSKPEALSIISKESAEFYKMLPLSLDKKKGILEIGMVFPENNQAKEALKFLTRQQKIKSEVFLIALSDFQKNFSQYQSPERDVEKALESLEEEITSEKKRKLKKGEKEEKTSTFVEEAPIIKMVAVIFNQAVEGKASDIHIEPTSSDLRIRYRKDGMLYNALILPLRIHPAIVARVKILSRLKIDETRIPQDGRFSTNIENKRVDFRVSTFPTTLGEKVVIRVLDSSTSLESLEALGLSGRNLELVKKAVGSYYGMILVTGPTGSGKTTTLYTCLGMVNKEDVNIVTLEDPVEYFMEGVNQSQVMPEINYTFARGLRQILRQDPDIIMVGEIRDEETASLAVHAALTGHLVFSTLHTTSAPGVVPRLLDMGIKSFLLPPTLNVIISQRLVRVLCPDCKKKVKADSKAKSYILEKIKTMPEQYRAKIKTKDDFEFHKPVGCNKCGFLGFRGRLGVFEVMEMSDKLAESMSQTPNDREIFKIAREQGMITMEEDGVLKVLDGITSIEEVLGLSNEQK